MYPARPGPSRGVSRESLHGTLTLSLARTQGVEKAASRAEPVTWPSTPSGEGAAFAHRAGSTRIDSPQAARVADPKGLGEDVISPLHPRGAAEAVLQRGAVHGPSGVELRETPNPRPPEPRGTLGIEPDILMPILALKFQGRRRAPRSSWWAKRRNHALSSIKEKYLEEWR